MSDQKEWGAEDARRDEEREALAKMQRELFNDEPDDDIQPKFVRFHAENPHVMELIVEATRRLARLGHRNFGMKAIFEGLRWEHALRTVDESGFKLCNNYTSRYSRLIEELYPDLRGFYRLRALRSKKTPEEE